MRNFGIQTPTITLPLGVVPPSAAPQAKQKLRQRYNIASETPIVLFLSRLHYKKRPDLLLEALARLADQDNNFHLILAGSGEPDYFNYLLKLVYSLGLKSQASFAGFVTGEEKQLLLQGSDIFVLPSFSENFGVAVAEAMAAGLPVIVTPQVQIAPNIAAERAGLVVEGEIEPLKNAIATLLTSAHLCQQLSENGQRLASRRYSWTAIAQNLSSAYCALIQKQPLPLISYEL